MSGYRGSVAVSAGPSRCSLVGGGAHLLVRVRLFDDETAQDPQPEAYSDLRPGEARALAARLLCACEDAERASHAAGYWRPRR